MRPGAAFARHGQRVGRPTLKLGQFQAQLDGCEITAEETCYQSVQKYGGCILELQFIHPSPFLPQDI